MLSMRPWVGIWLWEAMESQLSWWWTRDSPRHQVPSLWHPTLETAEKLRTEGPPPPTPAALSPGPKEGKGRGEGACWFPRRQEVLGPVCGWSAGWPSYRRLDAAH